MSDEYAHRRFPDGIIRQFALSDPAQAVCAGMGGTCREFIDWQEPANYKSQMGAFCTCCRCQLNLEKICRQIRRIDEMKARAAIAKATEPLKTGV